MQTGRATQAIIGVQLANGGPRGATVAGVTPGSPAAAAGIAPGDLVTRVDNRVIEDANALVAAIQSSAPNQVVTLTVASTGAAPRPVQVTLGSRVIGGAVGALRTRSYRPTHHEHPPGRVHLLGRPSAR